MRKAEAETLRRLTLDLAGTIGWAAWIPGSPPISGTRTLPDCGENLGLYFSKGEVFFIHMIERFRPERIAIERPIFASRKDSNFRAIARLMGLYGLALMTAEKAGIQAVGHHLQSVRSVWIPGTPNRTEALKVASVAMAEKLGVKPKDHNAADALGVLAYDAKETGHQIDWPLSGLFGGNS